MTTNETKARVLVAERPHERIDLSRAKDHGDVCFLMQDSDPSCFNSDEFVSTLRTRLEEFKFDPGVDSFCIAGPATTQALVLAALMKMFDVVRVLMYSPNASRYMMRTIDFRGLR